MIAALRSPRILAALAALVVSGTLATQTVEIAPGDTLSAIAAETGVTVADLVAWNDIADADLIIAGESLVIRVENGDGSFTTYVVQPGDTLGVLARRFGSTIEALAEANGLTDPDHIVAGQILTNGAPRPDGDGYTVEPGDTLLEIARAHGLRTADLVEANDLHDPDQIVAGQLLAIPGASAPAVDAPEPDPPTTTTTVPPTTTTPAPTTTTVAPPAPTTPAPTPTAVPSPGSGVALTSYFDTWTAAYGVDRGLLEALLWVESGWQPTATGPDGQLGIAQLRPETIVFIEERLLGLDLDPVDASDGIRMAARYLRYLIDRTDDDRSALAAWNQGLDRYDANGISATAAEFVDEVLAVISQRTSP